LVDADPELLLQFPDQGLLGPLARLDLAAGKFPEARHRLAGRALRDQHARVRIDESASGDEDELHAHDLATDHTEGGVKPIPTRSSRCLEPGRWLMTGYASAAVIPVDRDVLLGEVAGEHPVAAAPEPERDLERDLRLLHRRRDLVLVVGGVALAL